MPYVNLKVTPGISADQRRQIVTEVTDMLVRILGKNPDHTHIVIDEIDSDKWGFSGKLTSDH